MPSLSSKLYVSLHLFFPRSQFSFFSTPTRRAILAVHVSTAPAYRRPPSDTMRAADKVANSSDCWICPHSHVTLEDSCLLGLPTSFRDLMGLTAKRVAFSFTTPCSKEGRAGQETRGGQTLWSRNVIPNQKERTLQFLSKVSLCFTGINIQGLKIGWLNEIRHNYTIFFSNHSWMTDTI